MFRHEKKLKEKKAAVFISSAPDHTRWHLWAIRLPSNDSAGSSAYSLTSSCYCMGLLARLGFHSIRPKQTHAALLLLLHSLSLSPTNRQILPHKTNCRHNHHNKHNTLFSQITSNKLRGKTAPSQSAVLTAKALPNDFICSHFSSHFIHPLTFFWLFPLFLFLLLQEWNKFILNSFA